MLSLLHIENIAVIESADISFDRGFNVLTGETGAGKSIVIDAISAILGERAYRDMIRTGAAKASVRAVFMDVPEYPWFSENGVEYDPETVIQREIYLDGKNICRVNGSLISVSILRKLGIQLINIHGQHDSASLFDEENHLAFLDAFADNQSLRESYSQAYQKVSELRREIDSLTGRRKSPRLRRSRRHSWNRGRMRRWSSGESSCKMRKNSAADWKKRRSACTAGRTRMERPDCWPRRSMRWPDWDGSVTAFSPSTTGWRTSCIRFRMRRKRYGIPGTA